MQHLIDVASMDRARIEQIFKLADRLQTHWDSLRNQRPLNGLFAANLFYENSTRTRVSFEIAAKQLGAELTNIQAASSSVVKGESLMDTFHTLCAMGIRLFNVRHPQVGAPQRLVDTCPENIHIINAGDGVHAHPTQALLDAYVLHKHLGELHNKTVVIAGDLQHSRVARSDIAILKRLGIGELRLAAPENLHINPAPINATHTYSSLDPALADADAVIMLRIQKERFQADTIPDDAHYHQAWGLNQRRLQHCKPACYVLHPGPVNRGVEITDEVLDGPQSLVLEQVRMGVFIRMAVMLSMLKPEWTKTTLEC